MALASKQMGYNTFTWMPTCSGIEVEFDAADWAVLPIEDIASALANTCRFNGHVKRYYSVAEHCVLISRMVPEELALAALLHDASEAYVGDLTRGLKRILPAFKDLEMKATEAVARGYGVSVELLEHPTIKEFDKRILGDEAAALLPPHAFWEQFTNPTGAAIEGWQPAEAKHKFLQRYAELTNTTAETAA